MPGTATKNYTSEKKQIRHHARPKPASATAFLRTALGADMCKTGSGTGKCPGTKSDPVHWRAVGGVTTHGRTTRQAGETVPTDAVGGWQVHAGLSSRFSGVVKVLLGYGQHNYSHVH